MKSNGSKVAIHSVGAFVLLFGQWLISILLVRLGGYEDAGLFALAMSISNVFAHFANYGIRTYQISDTKGEFTQNQYQIASWVTIAASYVLCVGYFGLVGSYSLLEKAAILLYLSYNNVNSFSEILFGRLQLDGHLEINGFSSILRGVLCFAAFLGAFLLTHRMLPSLAVMVCATALVVMLFDCRLYRRLCGKVFQRCAEPTAAIATLLKQSFPLMAANVIPLIATAVPRRTIQQVLGTTMLGYFSSLFTPTVVITVLVPMLLQSVLPEFSALWKQGQRVKLLRMTARYYGVVAFLVTVALGVSAVMGRWALGIVFGLEILEYFPLLYWAILATGCNAVTVVSNYLLISMRKNHAATISTVVAAGISAAVSAPLVAHFGIAGGALALIAAYFVQALMQIVLITCNMYQSNEQGANDNYG